MGTYARLAGLDDGAAAAAGIATGMAVTTGVAVASRAAGACAGAIVGAGALIQAVSVAVLNLRRENGEAEELVADIIRKFLARRYAAEAIRRNQQIHLGYHLEDNGDADGDIKGEIADMLAGYADRADQVIDLIGHNGVARYVEHHILADGHASVAGEFAAGGIGKYHVDRNINDGANTGKTFPVRQALDAQIAHRAFDAFAAAADEFQRRGRPLKAGLDIAKRHAHVIHLLLLHACIIDLLHLDANALGHTLGSLAADAAGAAVAHSVLGRIKGHVFYLL